mmetsp:Transcript_133215/g.231027  ORF Transcript_133215/g.231027 Transcript_133215/m.231027 type:complete len:81 (+) Transcript_133215:268-510(+)
MQGSHLFTRPAPLHHELHTTHTHRKSLHPLQCAHRTSSSQTRLDESSVIYATLARACYARSLCVCGAATQILQLVLDCLV